MIFSEIIGNSVNGVEIPAQSNFSFEQRLKKPFTLIIAGIHGDERATVPIAEHFISRYVKTGNIAQPVCVIPIANPDGYEANTRTNARGVDINRNFPYNWEENSHEPPGTAPLSEPESRALYDFLLRSMPARIISLHWALSEIDADGEQSLPLAEKMWASLTDREKRKYRLKHQSPDLEKNAECPGSLGQWCGYGLGTAYNERPAMITLELPYTVDSARNLHPLPDDSFATVVRIWNKNSAYYIKQTEPSVHKMLLAACI